MRKELNQIIEKLQSSHRLEREEYLQLLNHQKEVQDQLRDLARAETEKHFHRKIYIRGLIEISNICKNNCYYCGIRRGNKNLHRYHLSMEEILEAVDFGSQLGFQTFVLQGGEDPRNDRDFYLEIIRAVKAHNPQAALTLSIGEWSYEDYKAFKEAGADRFFLRHETRNKAHYRKLHPEEMDLDRRIQCLRNLKSLGYQTGTGIMVGSPYQSKETIIEDLLFIQDLQPEMVGIGPYVPHEDTPFGQEAPGSVDLTVFLIHILRLMLPNANIPATTSLNTLSHRGRDRAIDGGANVYMPNLTPAKNREDYSLYNNKACFKVEAGENLEDLKKLMADMGYEVVMSRGDFEVKNV